MAESRVEDLLETGVEQPVVPMSEIEAILRGEPVTPHSRIAELLLKYNPSDILIEKRITENGTYFATNDDADGYYKVVVDEYVPTLILKEVTANGTYDPAVDGADGYSSITVNVQPLLERVGINITENGMSSINPSQGYDGLEAVALNVNVQPPLEAKNIDDNGTYTPSSGMYGFSSVTVAVPKGSNANITLHCQGLGGGTVTITATNSGQTYTHTNSITTDDEDTTFSNLEYVGNWTVTNSKDSSTLTVNNSAVEADLKLLTPSIPKMISATLPKGEVSCSSSLDDNTYALFAVDKHMSDTGSQYYGNPNIGWQGNDSAPWIKYEFDEPVFFSKLYFRLHSRWDSSWATNRSYTWMVEGSNDDITYETVLANGDDTVTQHKSYNYWWIFDLALNGKKYKYLRLSTNHTMYSRDYWNENMLDLQLYSDPNAVEPITPADIHIRCLGVDGGTVTITATDGSTTYTHTASVTLTDETVIFDNLEYAGVWAVTNSKDATTATVNNTYTEGSITLMVSKIPQMTSASTPYGECISSSNNWGESRYVWYPFDGYNGPIDNSTSEAWSNQRGDSSPWIGYHFMDSQGNPIKVKMDKVWVQGFCVVWGNSTTRTLYFEGSNDGTNWEKIGLDKTFDFGINTRQSFEHELNGGKYEYFRVRFDASLNVVDSRWIFIERIQVYANDFAPLPTGALTATENGTYDPEDYDLSAFDEVTVNVSLPSNAYLLKSIPSTPTDIASFTDGANLPMPYLKIGVDAWQEGSGDPSPSNVRPIHGWDEVKVNVSSVNIWDEEWDNCTWANGVKTANNNVVGSKAINPIVPNSTCYFRLGDDSTTRFICYFDQNGNYMSNLPIYNDSGRYKMTGDRAFIVPDGAYYYAFSVGLAYGATYNNDISINYPSTDTEYHAYNGHTYTIDLDGTRYGGMLDATNGTMVVDRAILTNNYLVNTASYESAGRGCFVIIGITLKSLGSGVVDSKLIASALKTDSQNNLYSQNNIGIAHWWDTRIGFSTGDSNITSVSAFKEWLALNGSNVCYELATPLTIQLTPTAVKSLEGINNIFADSGQILDGEYLANPS